MFKTVFVYITGLKSCNKHFFKWTSINIYNCFNYITGGNTNYAIINYKKKSKTDFCSKKYWS